MITHLMMDVDGVVITGRPKDGLPWKTDLETDLGLPNQSLIEAFFEPYWSEIVIGRRDLKPTLEQVLARIAPTLNADQLIDYWFSNDSQRDTAVLRDLKMLREGGLAIYFATNQDALRTTYLWEKLKLNEYADEMLSSSTLAAAKPSQAFFERIGLRTKATPATHLLIDDSRENVEAARACGWQAYQWLGHESLLEIVQGFQSH